MIHHGDCLEVLRSMPENSVDAIVTDPPYGWRFMGKAWDAFDIEKMAKNTTWNKRDKMMSDGSVRKARETPAESAGTYDTSLTGNQSFQIFTEGWAKEAFRILKPGGHMLVFCGPRTYHRMASGVEDAGFEIRDQLQWLFGSGFPKSHNLGDGRGTALKPANEPIVLARKPLSESTVAKNVLRWGTGALNIDASRIGYSSETDKKLGQGARPSKSKGMEFYAEGEHDQFDRSDRSAIQGRWPANVLFDEAAAEFLGEPARFFYCAKASKSERGAGLDSYERVDIVTSCKKDESTAAVQLLQRVISESTVKWLIGESGVNISAIFPKACKSIIRTEINKIIELETLSLLIRSLISENTPDASTDSSLVESVANLKKFLLSITNEKTESALGAVNAASKMLHTISESAEPVAYSSNHPTVKPIKLMEYLIKLITPPGGVVLDPFAGSGSTLVAAKRLGFEFIGIEMNEEYVEIARRRVGTEDSPSA